MPRTPGDSVPTSDGGTVNNEQDPKLDPNPVDEGRSQTPNDEGGKRIDPNDHQRAIDDMLKYKGQVREAQSTIDELKNKIKEIGANQLKEKEDYKSLYEAECEAHQETKKRVHGLESSFYTTQKYNAVYPKLVKAGLRDEAKKLLDNADFSMLEVETTSEGRVFVNGVDTFVDQFKNDYPFAFEEKRAPRINSGGSGSNDIRDTGPMTGAKLFEIEKKHGRSSEQYKKAFDLLVSQKKQA